MLEILTHWVFFWHVIWNIYLYQLDANFMLNVDFTYFSYCHQSGDITCTSEHCLTYILFYTDRCPCVSLYILDITKIVTTIDSNLSVLCECSIFLMKALV